METTEGRSHIPPCAFCGTNLPKRTRLGWDCGHCSGPLIPASADQIAEWDARAEAPQAETRADVSASLSQNNTPEVGGFYG